MTSPRVSCAKASSTAQGVVKVQGGSDGAEEGVGEGAEGSGVCSCSECRDPLCCGKIITRYRHLEILYVVLSTILAAQFEYEITFLQTILFGDDVLIRKSYGLSVSVLNLVNVWADSDLPGRL